MTRPTSSSAVPLPIAALAAIGALGIAATCIKGMLSHDGTMRGRSARANCVAPTRVVPSVRATHDPPVLFDVDRDGEEELVLVQSEVEPGRYDSGQRVFLTAIDPRRDAPLWRTRVENSPMSYGRNATARAHLVRLGDRVVYVDTAGHLRALDLATGQLVARVDLDRRFSGACASPDGAAKLWLDGTSRADDMMVDGNGLALAEPRPAWCPDLRTQPLLCPPFGSASACRRLSGSEVTAPEFSGRVMLRRAPFAIALGTHQGSDEAMVVGVDPDTLGPLWTRRITQPDDAPAPWGAADRGDILGTRVYVPHPVSGGYRLAAIDASTGALAWDVPLPCSTSGGADQAPVGISATLTRVYVQSSFTTVALDVNTGAVRWLIST